MEILFENKFSFTKEIHEEMTNKTISLWYKLFFSVMALGLLFVSIMLINIEEGIEFFIGIFYLVMSIFLACWAIFGYRLIAKRKYKQISMINNNKIINYTISFFQDKIHLLSSNGGDITYDYKDVNKIIFSKNIDILILENKVCIIVKKDGFTKGSLGEFEKFILSVCTDVKIKGGK